MGLCRVGWLCHLVPGPQRLGWGDSTSMRTGKTSASSCARIPPASAAEPGLADQGSRKRGTAAAQSTSDKLHQLGGGCLSHLLTRQPAFQAAGCVWSDGGEGAGGSTARRALLAGSPAPGRGSINMQHGSGVSLRFDTYYMLE